MSYAKELLGNYIDVLSGFAFKTKDFADTGVPIIKIKNIKPPYVSLEDLTFVSNEIANIQSKYLLKYNDVLIAMTGSHINQWSSVVGRVARVKYNQASLLNQRVGKIIVKDNALADIDYIYYFLSQDEVKIELANIAGGAANQANISPKQIKNLLFPCPDVKIQRKIANILKSYDELIDNNKKQIKLLEEAAQRLYKEWFIDLRFPGYENTEIIDGIPNGWNKLNIGEYLQVRSGYAFKSSCWRGNGYPVVKIKDIENNTIDLTDISFVDPEKVEKAKEFLLNKGDIVIAMTGATIGKIGLVPEVENLFTNQRVGKIFPSLNLENPTPFVFCFYNQSDILDNILALSSSSSAQPNISGKQLESFEIVANIDVINYFSRTTQPMFEKIIELYKQIRLLQEARNRLLPKLMSGEIEV